MDLSADAIARLRMASLLLAETGSRTLDSPTSATPTSRSSAPDDPALKAPSANLPESRSPSPGSPAPVAHKPGTNATLVPANGATSCPGNPHNPAEVARWFGAMQSQDLASGLWSFGVRLPHLGLADVEASIADGSVLRTWTQRGTIHFVAAEDTRWMLRICGSRSLSRAAARRAHLGIENDEATRAIDVLTENLVGGRRLTRAEASIVLGQAGINSDGQRLYHLLWFAAQSGVTCIGPNQGKEQTFVLLDEWAPTQTELDDDEALAELALRYFRSHGPTTRQDFAGWAGITAAMAKRGISGATDSLTEVAGMGKQMWLSSKQLDQQSEGGSRKTSQIWTLPGFDEYLLGFKDRSIPVPSGMMDRIIPGRNGVFQATVVQDGRVIATWKRRITKTQVRIDLFPLKALSEDRLARTRTAFNRYADFLCVEAEVQLHE